MKSERAAAKKRFDLKKMLNVYTVSGIASFGVFFVVVCAAFLISYKKTNGIVRANMESVNLLYVSEIEGSLRDAQKQLEQLAAEGLLADFVQAPSEGRSGVYAEGVDWLTQAVLNAFPVLERIVYFDSFGSPQLAEESAAESRLNEVLTWIYLNDLPEKTQFFVTLPDSGVFSPYFIVPIRREGGTLGFVAAKVSRTYLYKFLGRQSLGKSGALYVCDKNLNMLCGALSQRQWADLLLENRIFADDLLPPYGENCTVLKYKPVDGKRRRIAVSTQGRQFGVVLVSSIDEIDVVRESFSSLWSLVVATFFMFVAAAAMIILVYRRLDAPLEKMVARCLEIKTGGGEVLFEHCGDRGLNILADTLNETMRSISAYQTNLETMAFTDMLLGIGNRSACVRALEDFIKTEEKDFSIFMVDVVDFDHFNEVFSVKAGDMLLRQTAAMLDTVSQSNVFRYNGDTFVVVILDADGAKCSSAIQAIKDFFRNPVVTSAGKYSISMDAARADFPEHGETPTELLRNCKTALKYAKTLSARNLCISYNSVIADAIGRRNVIKDIIVEAVNRKSGIEVVYQPIYSVAEGHFTRLEALLRVKSTQFTISPQEAVSIAEENGLINDLGDIIIREVCAFARKLQDRPMGISLISVNLSIVQLLQHGFLDRMRQLLIESQVPLSFFEFEITENVLIASFDSILEKIRQLKALGIRFALDDFGAGYSGINYLANLPIDTLKLDSSIVQKFGGSRRHDAFIKSIIGVCKEFSIDIVTEGVETQEILKRAVELGADYVQGFFYAPPMAGSRLYSYIEESRLLAAE